MKHPLSLSLLAATALIAGCGGGGGGSTPAASTTAVTTTASLGAIKNAPYRVLALDGVTALAPAGTTGADGAFPVLNIPSEQPFILEISGASGASYFDEAKGADVPFTTGSLHVVRGSASATLGVSALTEIAYQRALKLGGGTLTAGAINAANQSVSQAFGVADVTSAPSQVASTADLNALTNTEAGKYAARLAALAKLAATANTGDATPALTIAAKLANDLSDGTLDGKHDAADIASPGYAPGTFGADWGTALAAITAGVTDAAAKTALAGLTGPMTSLPQIPVALSGVPAAGSYTARINDGSACSVGVSGANATVTAAGQTISVALDGTYAESTGGDREIGPGIFGTGTVRNYAGYATVNGALISIDLNFDGNGKLIYSYASRITDSSPNPAAGTNTTLVCAGNGFAGNIADLPPSGLNAAPASNFTATALVGSYNAPLNLDGSGACTFSIDNKGNFSITTASLPNGKMDVPYTALVTNTQTAAKVQYEVHPAAGDWFLFDINRQPDGTTGAGILVNGSLSKTCSTGNDPTAKWAAIGSHAGTYTGHTQTTGTADMTNSFNHACSLTIAADGTATYTASTGASIVIGPKVAGASVGKSTNNQGQTVDYLDRGNAAMSLYFTGKNVTATDNFTLYDTCTWQ